MNEGNNSVAFNSATLDGKAVTGKFTAVKKPSLSAHIVQINDSEYFSGMPVVLGYNSKDTATIRKIYASL